MIQRVYELSKLCACCRVPLKLNFSPKIDTVARCKASRFVFRVQRIGQVICYVRGFLRHCVPPHPAGSGSDRPHDALASFGKSLRSAALQATAYRLPSA